MKTTIEAFRDFYVALGGSIEDVQNIVTIPDMIEALTNAFEDGTVVVPAATDIDGGGV